MTDAEYRILLAARRAKLVQTAQMQRVRLAQSALPLRQPWVWLERGIGVWRTLRAHPWALLAPTVALALWRPRGVLRALPVLLAIWRAAVRPRLR